MIRSLCLASLVLIGLPAGPARTEEYFAVTDGLVLGRDTGAPAFAAPGRLILAAEGAFYFKTLELFNLEGILGETFTGYRAPVSLRYRPHRELGVEVGVMLGHEFGDDNRLNDAAPILRLVYEPTPDVFIIGGTVVPTHWLHDALFDDTRKLRTDVEQGFQLRADRTTWKHDTWVNWRVREGADRAEEFEIGLSNQFRLWSDTLRLDAQFLWTHAGGQMSTSGRIEQSLLYLTGFSVGREHPLGGTLLEDVRAGYAWLYSRDETDHSGLFKGFGRSYTAHADLRLNSVWRVRLFGEIYDGDRFTATLGDPLYGLDDYVQRGINLLFDVADEQLHLEVGFVSQGTADQENLSYQLAMVWEGWHEVVH